MAIIFVLIAFILCWIWIELTIFISNRRIQTNINSYNFNKKFIWYLRLLAITLFVVTSIYMYFFQKVDLQKALQYCLGIIQ